MGHRLVAVGLLGLLLLPSCNQLPDLIDRDYRPTVRESLSADADTAASLAAATLGDGTLSPDVKPSPKPKPKPNEPTICPRCEGTGKLFGDGRIQPTCPDCKGTGRIKSGAAAPQLATSQPVASPTSDPDDYASNIANALGPKLAELGDRIVGSIEGYSLKTKSYYSDMEHTTERLINAGLPEAKPTMSPGVTQRDCRTDAETMAVTLVVGCKFDSREHQGFHSQVLPNLPKSWTVRYMFYAPDKKMANALLPKHLIKSGLNITTLVGAATAKQLLSVAYPEGPVSPRTDPISEAVEPF